MGKEVGMNRVTRGSRVLIQTLCVVSKNWFGQDEGITFLQRKISHSVTRARNRVFKYYKYVSAAKHSLA